MPRSIHRHDISDKVWSILGPLLPGQKGGWGCVAKDNRLFINAVFWILRTGSPWRDLPSSYGDWKNTHRRFSRWRDKGIWEGILDQLTNNPDFDWLMIDSTYIKVHMHGTGSRGGNQSMDRTKGGLIRNYIWPWMRLVCRSELLLRQVPQLIVEKLRPLLKE